MKVLIHYFTGLEEETSIEIDTKVDGIGSVDQAFEVLDARRRVTNDKIVQVREFLRDIEDTKYRVLFTQFMDQFLGISSNARGLGAQSTAREKSYIPTETSDGRK